MTVIVGNEVGCLKREGGAYVGWNSTLAVLPECYNVTYRPEPCT
ncbi:hypothetical protein Pogu_2105 [Pyrobaculum oguniense TE7]|uniref:Uncharacterized protein n=1 Tax=Pyrobaculum oguniense (strain DSM 13380 / JCM 10595 / TE7) TaxID=698757 RepID=H6QCT6_PYROT|nr:hypothetical protein Pogu_2105 [Pyrobaculum oguniense TE7]